MVARTPGLAAAGGALTDGGQLRHVGGVRRRATWLDVPVRGIIRARWEIDGYVFNLGLANSWFAGVASWGS